MTTFLLTANAISVGLLGFTTITDLWFYYPKTAKHLTPHFYEVASIIYLIMGFANLVLMAIAPLAASTLFIVALTCFFISGCYAWIYSR